jgi:hypothetical protein
LLPPLPDPSRPLRIAARGEISLPPASPWPQQLELPQALPSSASPQLPAPNPQSFSYPHEAPTPWLARKAPFEVVPEIDNTPGDITRLLIAGRHLDFGRGGSAQSPVLRGPVVLTRMPHAAFP